MNAQSDALRNNFLLAAANALCEDAPELSRSLARVVLDTHKNKKSLRNRICLNCASILIPGKNMQVSLKNRKVERKCLDC